MKTLSTVLTSAANKLDQDDPWLVLLEINIPGIDPFYIVNNNEDVTFDGNVYVAFGFMITLPKENTKGEIPSIQLSIVNVTRTLQTYIEEYQGGVGGTVTLIVVNAGLLAENYAELTLTLQILGAKSNSQYITFTLGGVNPLNRKFPPDQYIAMHCRFRFKGPKCGYSGSETDCNRNLDRCRELNNSARFGGFPGLDGQGIRLA